MLSTRLKNILSLIILVVISAGQAQELPPIQNFAPNDYLAENQNWSVSQGQNGLLYFANNRGLLEYNGNEWTLYPSPNQTILRSVKVIKEQIYTGSYMEFGYWNKNNENVLEYHSISKGIENELLVDEQIWNILPLEDDTIIFQSLDRLYLYNLNSRKIDIVKPKNKITKAFKVNYDLYYQVMDEGIYRWANGKSELIIDNSFMKNKTVTNMFAVGNNIWILTQANGFYELIDNSLNKLDLRCNTVLEGKSIYSAIQLTDGDFVLGSISEGLIYISKEGVPINNFNQQNGLLNNTVLSLYEDFKNNIWLGLDNGISCINLKSPLIIYNDAGGDIGSVYASAIYEGNLYLGTNQGLFYKELNSQQAFKFIEKTAGQVWSLTKYNDQLFCNHHQGTFIVKDESVTKIEGTNGSWNVKPILDQSHLLLGSYNGLFILEKQQEKWSLKNKIDGFNISSRQFEKLDNNNIFVNHEYKGIYNIKVDEKLEKVLNIKLDSTSKGVNSGLTKYKGEIIFSHHEGIFKYNKEDDEFGPYPFLNSLFDKNDYRSGTLALDTTGNMLWNFSKSSINYIKFEDLELKKKVNRLPILNSTSNNISGYENILKIRDDEYLFGNVSGYNILNLSKWQIDEFEIFLNRVALIDNDKDFSVRTLEVSKEEISLESHENNLEFSYYVPYYQKYLGVQYQYKLEGLNHDWSPWTNNYKEDFKFLPHGEYVFMVRAKIGDKLSANIASLNFTIDKPWYLSNSMMIGYLILFLGLSILIHLLYSRNYKRQKLRLIQKNEQKLRLAQAEKQRELMKLKNKSLQEDYKSKSKELGDSLMQIVRKNELLSKIKNDLEKINHPDKIKPVIQTLEKGLNNKDDWETFQKAFNNVDKDFIKKLKNIYPTLTPNDLRLCAYLRLNLSSKEIAPLFNISPSSVEIKRYRLRKKMKLDHNKNLIKHILEF